ncbi:MAG: ABC transporter substrate-binding protein [Thermodesulfobacteriota bacterium]
METRKRRIVEVAIVSSLIQLTVLLLAIGVCVGQTQTPKPETLVLGFMNPLSGGAAAWGTASLGGAEVAVEDINAKGGVTVQGKRYIMRLIVEDDKYNPEVAMTIGHKFVYRDKVKFFIGPMGSALLEALLPVIITPNKIITATTAFSPIAKTKYSFVFVSSPAEKGPSFFRFLQEKYPKTSSICIVYPNDASGISVKDTLTKLGKAAGFTVVGVEAYERGTSDFYPLMSRVTKMKPDIIEYCNSPDGDVALMVRSGYELGYKGLNTIGTVDADFVKFVRIAGKEGAEGFIMCRPAAYDSPDATPKERDIFGRYLQKHGKNAPVSVVLMSHYGATWNLARAIEKANTFDPDVIVDVLEGLNLEMPIGICRFGGQKTYGIKRQLVEPIFYTQIKDGKGVLIGKALGECP